MHSTQITRKLYFVLMFKPHVEVSYVYCFQPWINKTQNVTHLMIMKHLLAGYARHWSVSKMSLKKLDPLAEVGVHSHSSVARRDGRTHWRNVVVVSSTCCVHVACIRITRLVTTLVQDTCAMYDSDKSAWHGRIEKLKSGVEIRGESGRWDKVGVKTFPNPINNGLLSVI